MSTSSSSSPAGNKSPPCGSESGSSSGVSNSIQGKRLHVSNIPFRFRSSDLWTMFGVRRPADILDCTFSLVQFFCRCPYIGIFVFTVWINNETRTNSSSLIQSPTSAFCLSMRHTFQVFGPIVDVEIIFNERGSKVSWWSGIINFKSLLHD